MSTLDDYGMKMSAQKRRLNSIVLWTHEPAPPTKVRAHGNLALLPATPH